MDTNAVLIALIEALQRFADGLSGIQDDGVAEIARNLQYNMLDLWAACLGQSSPADEPQEDDSGNHSAT